VLFSLVSVTINIRPAQSLLTFSPLISGSTTRGAQIKRFHRYGAVPG
jgi:hypothetical protein